LKEPGRRFWDLSFSERVDWIVPEADLALVQMACEMVDHIEILAKPTRDPNWDVQANTTHFYALRSLRTDLLLILKQLGFTPAERARLEMVVAKQEETPLQRIMRERQHKKAA
jgi:hypothetical protein